jgi:hypothetical protein
VKKFRISLVVSAALALAALLAVPALAGAAKIAPFKASFAGKATTTLTGTRVDISARGVGAGLVIGKKSVLSGKGVGTKSGDANCVPFTGPGTIVTSTKLTLRFTVLPSSSGCAGEDQNQVTVSGSGKFTGGTGKFKLARGTFSITGYYDRGTGSFTVKFAGTLRS